MLTYKPRNPPIAYDGNWIREELLNITKAASASNDGLFVRTLGTAPTKTNDGDIRIADGSNWDFRFGRKMLGWYDSVDQEWKGLVHVGTGGTKSQNSSKSTQVTLNTSTGEITMRNSALAADAEVSFTFNNTKLTATDVLILNIVGGATNPAAYVLNAACASGSAVISVRNVSTGSLSEAIVIRFTRIPGATS